MKSVSDIIHGRRVVTVERSASVLEAARRMTAHHIGALPVVDDPGSVWAIGIFTERDVLARVVAQGRDPATTTVGSCMSTSLITANADESYDACIARMHEHHVRHLVVLVQGRLAGILSLRDLLTVDLAEKSEAITFLTTYVSDRPV